MGLLRGLHGTVLYLGMTLFFVALKVFGYLDWPWVLVSAPVWIPFFLLIMALWAAIVHVCATSLFRRFWF